MKRLNPLIVIMAPASARSCVLAFVSHSAGLTSLSLPRSASASDQWCRQVRRVRTQGTRGM